MAFSQIQRRIILSNAVARAYVFLRQMGLEGVDYHGVIDRQGDCVQLRNGGIATVGNADFLKTVLQKYEETSGGMENASIALAAEIALIVARGTTSEATGFIVDGHLHADGLRVFWTGVKACA